jgi:tRNA threonylcarbamoyladenosine biosynthesis protein TsaE
VNGADVNRPAHDPAAVVVRCDSEDATDRAAAAFADQLSPGDVVALEGTLGAGKTRFVRGVAAALSGDGSSVNSPTFGLVQHYDGDLPLVHIDAYRLSGDDEFDRMGGAELFDLEAATFIEWSERIPASLPRERWIVSASHINESTREYRFRSTHSDAVDRLRRLTDQIATVQRGP